MRSTSIPALSLFALGAYAAPTATTGTSAVAVPNGECMTRAEALLVANNFERLQDEVFNVTLANAAVADDFIDYNDSINT